MNIKKFLGNKNTVTILGVVICVFVLYVGYNYQINRVANLVEMPVASTNIQPRTLITNDLVKIVKVPSTLLEGEFYSTMQDIVGKYSNYNSMIAQGSIFYKALLIDAESMPNAAYADVPEGHTVISYPVDIDSTYANTMEPETYINIYFKALLDDEDEEEEGKIIFGKFVHNVKVLAVKDSSGQNVFESSEEVRTPAYLFFAVPDGIFELIKKAQYIAGDYGIELVLVPNTVTLTEKDAVEVTSEQIRDYIYERTEMLDVNVYVENEDLYDPEAKDDNNEPQNNDDANNDNTNNQ